MSNKTKALVLIVEGTTDETLFAKLLKESFASKGIKIFPFRGDIFFSTQRTNTDIRNRIREFVFNELERQQISYRNVLGIIHIGDMDGTFIPDTNIVVNSSVSMQEKKQYADDNIHCATDEIRTYMMNRNAEKSFNHRTMISVDRITIKQKKIPYVHYFMSCDTDHLVFKLRNLTQEEKEELMDEFTDSHGSGQIRELLEEHMVRIPEGADKFRFTWDDIQQGLNSLSRRTNTPLLFDFISTLIVPPQQDVRAGVESS